MKKSFVAATVFAGAFSLLGVVSAQAQEMKPEPVFNLPVGISADSNRIFLQSWAKQADGKTRSQLFSLDRNGGDLRREARIGYSEGWPSFTKDGMKAALHTRIEGNAELVVMELRKPGNLSEFLSVKRLTVGTDADFFAAWSPDEKRIAFYSWRTDQAHIYVMDADGTNVRQLTDNGAGNSDPSWSVRDEITYESHVAGNADVWVMDGQGDNKRNLTDHPAADHWGDWSPDGNYIVFSSDRDGTENLYIMNRDGGDVRQLTDSAEVDHWPRWAPDGSYITFERRSVTGSDAFLISPDGSGEKRLTMGVSLQE